MARHNSARNILLTLFLYSSSSMLFAKPISLEQGRKAADTFLKAQNIRQERELKVLSMRAAQKIPPKKFTATSVKKIRGEEEKILAYIIELEPEGYIITAADSDIGPILGYSFKGKFPFEESKQNVLLHLVQWDVEAQLRALSSPTQGAKTAVQTNNKCWEEYIASDEGLIQTLSEPTQWPDPMEYGHEGWIKTHWDQGGHWEDPCNTPTDPSDDIWVETHYDDKCPLLQIGQTYRCAVGCVATAMAQIINYWKYPGKVQFDSSPWWLGGNAYTSQGNAGTINIDGDAMTRDFPAFSELNSALSTINYDGDPNEQAYLCFAVGAATGMYYGGESFTKLPLFAYKKDFYYGSADYGWDPTGVLWNLLWKQNVTENVKKGWPVHIGIEKFLVGQGHSVIVDGYKSTGEFHINCGWAGQGDFWYTLPIIDTSEALFPGNHYYDLISEIICNISSYQGWSQWGADEKNSFGTIYTYPTEEPDLKWEVTVPSDLTRYKFDYIVVGTGNKIYASLSPRDLGQGNCPYICIINPYGYIEKTIPVTDSDYDIDYLTQNHKGEIFFGSSEYINKTSIYRIDPKTEAATRIFDHTSPDGGHFDQPIKVDQDDYLYFFVRPKYTANSAKFYSINRSGSVLMSHTFSPEMKFYSSVAAIDETRNQIYLNYYNDSLDKSYLVCFNRWSGLVNWTHTFPGTHTASEMAGAPAVGEDGTIYIGCYTTLYALSPTTGNEIWNQDFYPAYAMRTPAIGHDGTLYVNYGKMVGGDWHPGFIRALDPADGTIKWEREVPPPLETFDNMGDIYAAGNGMVGFAYNKSGIAHIGGLIDHGDSGEILWDVEYGGKMIFGPGQTIYVVSSTADASSIYALSVGERGDPHGLGMGFADNHRPSMPSNPTPTDGAENRDSVVTLSWDCDDPDAHPLKYSVFVGESGYNIVPVATDINDTSYILEGLKPNTGYAWKIIATDGQAVTQGPTWVFATKPPVTIYVDDDYTAATEGWGCDHFANIQDAIDTAVGGVAEDIIVYPGTYYENINLLGKPLTLTSMDPNDPNVAAATIIDGNQTGSVVTFDTGEGPECVLTGFTITNGYANLGGGILCSSSSPTITSCTIANNFANSSGGGIYCEVANLILSSCTISGNSCNVSGGGIFLGRSYTQISNCIINGNVCRAGFGGGIVCNNSRLVMNRCTVSGNSANSEGGGINFSWGESATISNCNVSGNRGGTYGGGIFSVNYTSLTIGNCTLARNQAVNGKALACYSLLGRRGTVQVINSILWNGTGEIYNHDDSLIAIIVSYSDVEGGWAGQGNIDADPLFIDPASGDCHLKSQAGRWKPHSESWVKDVLTSPCIDAGNPGYGLGSEPSDPNNLRINMGAYGGTVEASKTPASWSLLADLTNDGTADFQDFTYLAADWLAEANDRPADLSRDSNIDTADLALFVDDWLGQTTWHEP